MAEDRNYRVDVQIALFNNYSERSQYLSERQFTITISILTLHLGILAGLIVSSPNMTFTDRVVSSIALTVFDGLVIYYICKKCMSYWDSRDQKDKLEEQLKAYIIDEKSIEQICTSTETETVHRSNQTPLWLRIWETLKRVWGALNRGSKGSLVFVFAIFFLWLFTSVHILAPASKTHGAQKTGTVFFDNTAGTITIMIR